MSASPIHRRLLSCVAGVLLGVGLLAGCGTGQKQAEDYKGLEESFIKGCEATVAADAEDPEAKATPSDDFCRCAFDALSDPDEGVEFGELMDINEELTDDQGKLPESVTATFASCS